MVDKKYATKESLEIIEYLGIENECFFIPDGIQDKKGRYLIHCLNGENEFCGLVYPDEKTPRCDYDVIFKWDSLQDLKNIFNVWKRAKIFCWGNYHKPKGKSKMYRIYKYTYLYGDPRRVNTIDLKGTYKTKKGARVALQNYIQAYVGRVSRPTIYIDRADIFRASNGAGVLVDYIID